MIRFPNLGYSFIWSVKCYLKVHHLTFSHRTLSSTISRVITVFLRWIQSHHKTFKLQNDSNVLLISKGHLVTLTWPAQGLYGHEETPLFRDQATNPWKACSSLDRKQVIINFRLKLQQTIWTPRRGRGYSFVTYKSHFQFHPQPQPPKWLGRPVSIGIQTIRLSEGTRRARGPKTKNSDRSGSQSECYSEVKWSAPFQHRLIQLYNKRSCHGTSK